MSIFKFTIKPVIKTKDWKVTLVGSGRKEKTCEICKSVIKIGYSSYTFLKRTSIGDKQNFISRYACNNRCKHLLDSKIQEENEKLAASGNTTQNEKS